MNMQHSELFYSSHSKLVGTVISCSFIFEGALPHVCAVTKLMLDEFNTCWCCKYL